METMHTLKETLFETAQSTPSIPDSTGSTLEIKSIGDEKFFIINGHAAAIAKLNLPGQVLEDSVYLERDDKPKKRSPRESMSTIKHIGNGYVSLTLGRDAVNRFQLNDLLNGMGWKLSGYSVVCIEGTIVHSEVWVKSVRPRRERKHTD